MMFRDGGRRRRGARRARRRGGFGLPQGNRTGTLSVLNQIPEYKAGIVGSKKIRYSNVNALATQYLTPAAFYFAFVCADSATLALATFESVRIRRIELWSPPQSGGGVTVSSVTFPQITVGGVISVGNASVPMVATTLGTAEACHVVAVPDERSAAGLWLDSDDNSTRIVQFTCPAGSLMDITYDFVMDWTAQDPSPFTYAGLQPGASYLANLYSGTTKVWTPVGQMQVA